MHQSHNNVIYPLWEKISPPFPADLWYKIIINSIVATSLEVDSGPNLSPFVKYTDICERRVQMLFTEIQFNPFGRT